MSEVVIRINDLGKQYRIGGQPNEFRTLRDSLTDAFAAPFRRARGLFRGQAYGAADMHETIWALKDVSLEIKRGEVVGIIGRNGAGKTTLLKILSRITEPTEGYAEIRGRVGSLLEVGTGFHPELTGRENIYLNGAILGMKKAEIERKFDEIVEFAEIEKFIDTPVKHYSSGMYVRLAFAVAAHLEPEILLVDEVLAVGDAAFQKKCIGKMGDVARENRTVLFISHNMAAVTSLCSKSLLLDGGRLVEMGETTEVVHSYQSTLDFSRSIHLSERKDRRGTGRLQFTNVHFVGSSASGEESNLVSGQDASIIIECRSPGGAPLRDVSLAVTVIDFYGNRLFTCFSRHQGTLFHELPTRSEIECKIPQLPLAPGTYKINLWGGVRGEEADYIENVGQFVVIEGDFFGTGILPIIRKHGPILVAHSWSLLD